jgi:hypothetical protein
VGILPQGLDFRELRACELRRIHSLIALFAQ